MYSELSKLTSLQHCVQLMLSDLTPGCEEDVTNPADKKEVLNVVKQNSFAVGTGKSDNAEGFFILSCYQPIYS